MVVRKVKVKVKIPRIQVDSKGKRFIRIKKRKVILDSKMSERELIAFIILQLTRKRTIRRVGSRNAKAKKGDAPTSSSFSSPTKLTPENAPEFFQHQVQLNKLQIKQEEPAPASRNDSYQPVADRLQILPSEILAIAPPGLSDEQKKRYVDQYFKDIYKMSVQEANTHYQKALVEKDVANADIAKAKAEIRRQGIFAVVDKFKAQTKDQLIAYAKAHNVSLKNPSQLKKDQIFQLIVDANAVDFGAIYDRNKASKIPIKLKPKQDDSASSPAMPQTGEGRQEGLSTDQINHMMSNSKHFLGTIGSDQIHELKIKPHTPFAFVMNTDPSNKPGSHWVSCYSDGKSSIEYFDSFADPPSKSFMKETKWIANQLQPETYLKFKQNRIVEQDNNSDNCGYFASKFLIDRIRGKPFAECTKYDDHIKGEKDIEAWKQKLHIKPFKYIDTRSDQEGEGLKEIYQGVKNGLKRVVHAVKTIATGSHRMNFTPSIRKILEQYGDQKISAIKVCRKPIHSVLNKVLNWVTLGVFQKNLRDLGYDNALHLFLLLKLSNGKIVKAEKNEVINIHMTTDWTPSGVESVDVSTSSNTLAQFFEKTRASIGDQKFFVYDSKTQNCQKFVEANLRTNGIWSPAISKWVLQDAESIYKGLGFLEKANKVVTDIAGVADHALHGQGSKPLLRRKIMQPPLIVV